jgi:hypothetical protein
MKLLPEALNDEDEPAFFLLFQRSISIFLASSTELQSKQLHRVLGRVSTPYMGHPPPHPHLISKSRTIPQNWIFASPTHPPKTNGGISPSPKIEPMYMYGQPNVSTLAILDMAKRMEPFIAK